MIDVTHGLTDLYIERHPEDAALLAERLTPDEAGALLRDLSPARAGALVARMAPMAGAACLDAANPDESRGWIGAIPPVVAARLLRPLDRETRRALLTALPAERRRTILALASSAGGSVGSIMDPRVFALPSDARVRDADEQLQRSPIPYVFVIDREHRLQGVVGLDDLERATPDTDLSSVMKRNVLYFYEDADLTGVLAHPAWEQYEAIPVVDRTRAYLGVLRHKALRRLHRADAPRPGVDAAVTTLVGLGELYWTGLLTVLAGATSAPLLPAERPSPRGGTHDA